MATPSLRAGVVARVPLKLLNADPDNPRSEISERSVSALAASVKARGVLVPLLVRKDAKGRLVVKDGHRRLAAAKVARVKDLPVLLAPEDDVAQLRFDQVAVNQLHEHLQPMDTARVLRKLRDSEKLTVNDLAARMAKAGTPMSKSEIEASIALTDLPEWAQKMVDARELALAAAPVIIAAMRDKPVAKALPDKFRTAAGWDGTVDKRRAEQQVEEATRQHGIDVTTRRQFYATAKELEQLAHFDWKKVCKGCEHLRAFHGEFAYCMSREGFERHQAEAKEAGLSVGGEKPKSAGKAAEPSKPLTKRQQEKIEAEKAERREKVDGTRAENYLDQWLRGRVALALTKRADIAEQIVLWLASSRPDAGLTGNAFLSNMTEMRYSRALKTASGRAPRLDAFLASPPTAAEYQAIAINALPLFVAPQIRELAMKLGITVELDWKADADYVQLRTREQLVEWLKAYDMPADGKVGDLRARVLEHPGLLAWTPGLPHMAALNRAFLDPIRDEVAAAEEIAADDDELQDDEDQAYDSETDDAAPESFADEEIDA